MKTVDVVLEDVQLGLVNGTAEGWLIKTRTASGEAVLHGIVHLINGETFTLSSATDERLQAFGWAPMFDSLNDLRDDVAIALAMESGDQVHDWLAQSERHDH